MRPGLSADLQLMDDSRKTAIINKELARLNIDVACLSETRLADSGSLMKRDYTFFWQGLSQDERRQCGVGFAVRNSLIATTETPSGRSSRTLALRMKTKAGFVNIISAYAPTLTSTPEAKDQFYEALQEIPSGIPSSEGIYLLGDFNARVGTNWQAWPICLGHFGVGRMNENGQRLLELISSFLDRIMTPVVKSLPSYIIDSTNALKIFRDFNFSGQDKLIFPMDITSLYTVIPNSEGLQALKHFFD